MWVEACRSKAAEFGRDLVELSEYTILIGSLTVVADSYTAKNERFWEKRSEIYFNPKKGIN